MPLERIRPKLSFDRDAPPHQQDSSADSGANVGRSNSSSSWKSNRSYGGLSSISPHTSYQYGQEDSSSKGESSSSSGGADLLSKLGGVGGVTRSGSLGRSSAVSGFRSIGGGGRSSLIASPEEQENAEAEAAYSYSPPGSFASLKGRAGILSGEAGHGVNSSASSDVPSSSSRTSTSSYSGAAFSLRSVSNRNSASSTSSISGPSSSRHTAEYSDGTVGRADEHSESGRASRGRAAYDEDQGSYERRSSLEYLRGDDDAFSARTRPRTGSSTGPGIGRIRSIGRGNRPYETGSEVLSQQEEDEADGNADRSTQSSSSSGPGLSRIRSIGKGGRKPSPPPLPPVRCAPDLTDARLHTSTLRDGAAVTQSATSQQPRPSQGKLTSVLTDDPPLLSSSASGSNSQAEPLVRAAASGGAVTQPLARRQKPLRLRMPSNEQRSDWGSPASSGTRSPPTYAPLRTAPLSQAVDFSRMTSPSLSSLAAAAADAVQTAEAHPAMLDVAPALPRRHSGAFALRTRSALSQHAGLQMTFGAEGGGRAAARAMQRSYDPDVPRANAPFSELEAAGRRSTAAMGPEPAASSSQPAPEAPASPSAATRTSPVSPSDASTDWASLSSWLNRTAPRVPEPGSAAGRLGPDRTPMPAYSSAGVGSLSSPIAQASPGVPTSSAWLSAGSQARGRHASGFSSSVACASGSDPPSPRELSESTAAPPAGSRAIGATLGVPSSDELTSDARSSTGSSGSSTWRQHARQTLQPIDVPQYSATLLQPTASASQRVLGTSPLSAVGLGLGSTGAGTRSPANAPDLAPDGSTSFGRLPLSARPSMSRSSSSLAGMMLRTPTTEEWSRYLAKQNASGLPTPAIARSRTTTTRSTGSNLYAKRKGSASAVASSAAVGSGSDDDSGATNLADAEVLPAENLDTNDPDQAEHMLERLKALSMSRLAASRAGSLLAPEADLESVHEDDEEAELEEDGARSTSFSLRGAEDDDWEEGSSVSSAESDVSESSSIERMRALHEAISRPPSRRGTPITSRSQSPDRSAGQERVRSSPSLASALASSVPLAQIGLPASALAMTSDASATAGKRSRKAANGTAATLLGYPPPPLGERRCINDFVVISDIGRGAYGLVKKVKLKGDHGEPVGPDFVIKYIIKSRILADCWRRHKTLGPIPVEIHVMDQLRRLAYVRPKALAPWAPERLFAAQMSRDPSRAGSPTADRGPDSLIGAAAPEDASSEVSHPSLCLMLDFFEDHEFYYLVMPYLTGTQTGSGASQDLFDFVESAPDGLSTIEVRSIFGQVADGVRFLHANSIVHRDIKDENVILDFRDGRAHAQLIDFGSAAHVRPGRLFDTFSGTLDYAAAEILRGEKYAGKEQDVWALGVVGYVLLCGDCPFWNGEEAVEGIAAGTRADIALRDRCSAAIDRPEDGGEATQASSAARDLGQADGGGRLDDAADLIRQCLQLDIALRPTAAQVCEHRFLTGQSGWHGQAGWLQPLRRDSEISNVPASASSTHTEILGQIRNGEVAQGTQSAAVAA